MARDPNTGKTVPDPVYFTGKDTITILPYHSGFVAYLPEITSGLCGEDLRKLALALIVAADSVDKRNRSYEAGKINNLGIQSEEIPITNMPKLREFLLKRSKIVIADREKAELLLRKIEDCNKSQCILTKRLSKCENPEKNKECPSLIDFEGLLVELLGVRY